MKPQATTFDKILRRAMTLAAMTLLVFAAGINWAQAATAEMLPSQTETYVMVLIAAAIALAVGFVANNRPREARIPHRRTRR
jgi:phosphate/sulfate permease